MRSNVAGPASRAVVRTGTPLRSGGAGSYEHVMLTLYDDVFSPYARKVRRARVEPVARPTMLK